MTEDKAARYEIDSDGNACIYQSVNGVEECIADLNSADGTKSKAVVSFVERLVRFIRHPEDVQPYLQERSLAQFERSSQKLVTDHMPGLVLGASWRVYITDGERIRSFAYIDDRSYKEEGLSKVIIASCAQQTIRSSFSKNHGTSAQPGRGTPNYLFEYACFDPDMSPAAAVFRRVGPVLLPLGLWDISKGCDVDLAERLVAQSAHYLNDSEAAKDVSSDKNITKYDATSPRLALSKVSYEGGGGTLCVYYGGLNSNKIKPLLSVKLDSEVGSTHMDALHTAMNAASVKLSLDGQGCSSRPEPDRRKVAGQNTPVI